HADTRVRARQLLEHEHVRQKVGARAAVLLGHAYTHEPQLGELRENLAREPVLAIPLRRLRLDPLAGEVAGERLDLTLLRAQLEVHGRSVISPRGDHLGWATRGTRATVCLLRSRLTRTRARVSRSASSRGRRR